MAGLLWFLLFLGLLGAAIYAIWLGAVSILSISFGQLLTYLLLIGAGYALGLSHRAGKE